MSIMGELNCLEWALRNIAYVVIIQASPMWSIMRVCVCAAVRGWSELVPPGAKPSKQPITSVISLAPGLIDRVKYFDL